MSDIQLFRLSGGTATELPGQAAKLEKQLQGRSERLAERVRKSPNERCTLDYCAVASRCWPSRRRCPWRSLSPLGPSNWPFSNVINVRNSRQWVPTHEQQKSRRPNESIR